MTPRAAQPVRRHSSPGSLQRKKPGCVHATLRIRNSSNELDRRSEIDHARAARGRGESPDRRTAETSVDSKAERRALARRPPPAAAGRRQAPAIERTRARRAHTSHDAATALMSQTHFASI